MSVIQSPNRDWNKMWLSYLQPHPRRDGQMASLSALHESGPTCDLLATESGEIVNSCSFWTCTFGCLCHHVNKLSLVYWMMRPQGEKQGVQVNSQCKPPGLLVRPFLIFLSHLNFCLNTGTWWSPRKTSLTAQVTHSESREIINSWL